MGIPSYFSYIIRNYAGIISPMITQQHYKHLFMDCNSIIYDCVRSFENPNPTDKEVIDSVIKKIKYYINFIRPSKTAFIAFDGVAPFAKMEQQRNRRLKTYLLSKILQDPNNSNAKKWDTTKITPGTEFMKQLSYEVSIEFKNTQKFGIENLIVSTANEKGEGEHKIFQYIRDNSFIDDEIIIYGLDSDLFMLSILNYKYVSNTFIFRESTEFINSLIDIDQTNCEFYKININLLINAILAHLDLNDNRRIYDYVFLCFFLGNDFLPHFPALNIRTHGIQTLLDIYKKSIKKDEYLVLEGSKIKWKNVNVIIKELSKLETDFLIEETKMRKKYDKWEWKEPKTIEEKEKIINNLPIIYRGKELYIEPGTNGWEDRYYKILFDCMNREQICKNYLEGLEWVLKYYKGELKDEKWKYNYNYGPLFKDIKERKECKELIKEEREGYKEEEQLKYILPPEERLKIEINWMYNRYFWEANIKK